MKEFINQTVCFFKQGGHNWGVTNFKHTSPNDYISYYKTCISCGKIQRWEQDYDDPENPYGDSLVASETKGTIEMQQ